MRTYRRGALPTSRATTGPSYKWQTAACSRPDRGEPAHAPTLAEAVESWVVAAIVPRFAGGGRPRGQGIKAERIV